MFQAMQQLWFRKILLSLVFGIWGMTQKKKKILKNIFKILEVTLIHSRRLSQKEV